MVEIVMKSREWQGPTKAITVGLSFLVQGLRQGSYRTQSLLCQADDIQVFRYLPEYRLLTFIVSLLVGVFPERLIDLHGHSIFHPLSDVRYSHLLRCCPSAGSRDGHLFRGRWYHGRCQTSQVAILATSGVLRAYFWRCDICFWYGEKTR